MKPEKEKMEKRNINNVNNVKNAGGNSRNKIQIVTPIILTFTFIIAVLLIGTGLISNDGVEISKIFSNLIMADTTTQDIGTGVVASFDSSTGELSISTSGTDTSYELNKEAFRSFIDTCGSGNITTITFVNEVYAPQDSSDLFSELNALTTINNANNLNVSNVTNMGTMFSRCSSLTVVDVSNWNTSNLTNMSWMFTNCVKLTTVDVSDWNTSNVTAMYGTFEHCHDLTAVDVSNWDVSSLENIHNMFYACRSLATLDMRNWDTSNVTDTGSMFFDLKNLTDIYTPKTNSTQTVSLPHNFYNVDDINDNNEYTEFTNETFSGSIHLRKSSYNISYELNGGETSTENPTTYNVLSSLTLNNPTKEGYTFTGWTGSNGDIKQDTVSIAPRTLAEDLTFTANWEAIEYTITYNLDGGNEPDPANPTSYTIETENIVLNEPSKEGYKFLGWTGSNGTTPQKEVTIAKGSTENKEYTANWEITEYTITYNLDGGEEPDPANPTSYTIETEDIELKAPTKTGYTFIGWTGTDIEEGPEENILISEGSTGNKEYTANWEITEYTITYNLDGGNEPDPANPTSYTIETENIVLNEPSKEGYKFLGWTGTGIESAEPTKEVTIAKGSTGNKEYTANWEITEYTITYNLDGGEEPDPANPTSYTIETEDIELKAPTKTGYTFLGWTGTDIEEGPEENILISEGSIGNKEYTANWEITEYTITYNLDGGNEPDPANPTSYTMETEDIRLALPTKEGYVFTGWTGTDLETEKRRVTIVKGSTGNREYTAQWLSEDDVETYTIEYDLGGGDEVLENPMSYIEYEEDIILKAPTRTGYTFIGWTGTGIESDEPTKEVIIPEGSTGNREYIAHWEVIEYTITYNLDGGIEPETPNPTSYTIETEFAEIVAPTKKGCIFLGWTGTDLEYVTEDLAIIEGLTGDREYIANWETIEYTITYDLDGGMEPETPNPGSYTIETEDIILQEPIKDGYRFLGWTGTGIESEEPRKEVTIAKGSMGDREYIAHWEIIEYTITYNLDGGTESDPANPTSYTIESESIILKAPTREGYRFLGWTGTDLDVATREVTIAQGSTGDRDYTANWKSEDSIEIYTIEYDLDGGEEVTANPTSYTEFDETIILKAPTKEGYDFIGWTGTGIENDQPIEELKIVSGSTGNRKYIANWRVEDPSTVYGIEYDLDGGYEIEENPINYTKQDEDIVLNEPVKDGYRFIGWTGTGIESDEPTKEVTIPTGSKGNRSYKANWEIIKYTIVYDLDGGVQPEPENPTSYTVRTRFIELVAPTKEGYIFLGWTGTDVEDISEVVEITEGSTGDREYTAHWEAIEYTITYDLDEGYEGEQENPISYTIETENIVLRAPIREGYWFTGWTGTDIETETKRVTIEKGSVGDREYTAHWISEDDLEIYTIEYDLDGGYELEENPTRYISDDEDIILQEPIKDGYRFLGWTGTDIDVETKEVTIEAGSTGNREYIAHWEIIEYTITYNLDGGETTNPTSYTIETEDIELEAPTREGYIFIGWTGTDIEEGPEEIILISEGLTGDREYTAHWEAEEYTITYNLDGGNEPETSNPETYTIETENIVLNEPTKEGYTFIGWTGTGIESDEPIKELTITKGSTGDKEYTANWEAIEYTITYNLDGGNEADPANPTSYTMEDETIVLNEPTKEGYTFVGWTGSNGTTAQKELTIAKGSTGNKEYTANWEAIEYTITYNLDGGNGSDLANPTSYTIETENIVLNEPTKEGYTFIGWTGSNGTISQKELTITKGSTGDKEYTANWEAIEYTITYNLNGGNEPDPANPTSYTMETEDIILKAPTKEGYIFMGWTGTGIESDKPTKEVTIAKGSMGDKEYTANWKTGEYTITYNLNGGTETTNPDGYTKEDEDIVLKAPTKAGYTFTGWTGTGIDVATKEVTIAKGSIGNKEYTAHWEIIEYTITYNLAGGSEGDPANPISYTIETEDIVLRNPIKEGYVFIGWTGTDIDVATKEVTITKGSTGNREYVANWKAGEYTITYNLNGGTETTNPESYTKEDENIVLKAPTRAGYTFTGWTGTGIESDEPTKVVTIAKGSIGDREYTANWEIIEYTITYNLAGGNEGDPANPTSYTIETEDIILKAPTKEGYIFMGWTGTEIDTATKEVTIAKGSTGNREYTASWKAGEYTITYNLNGGTETTNPDGYTKEDEDIVLKAPTRAGYTFTGWTGTGIEGTEPTKEVTIARGSTGNREYTANWEIIEYTITYNLAGGNEGKPANPTNYTVETEDIILKAPTKEGYIFMGWTGTDLETETKEVTITKGSTGNREYVANWLKNTKAQYTIKHWTQNLNGNANSKDENNYTLKDTESLEGIIESTVTPNTKTYEGFLSPRQETLTITEDGNAVLNYYYARRTDLTCIVKYIDKETKEVIEEHSLENKTFESEIEANKEIKEFEDYEYDSLEPEILKVGIGENVINIYYVKKEGKVIVHHYIYDEENKNTTQKLVEDEEIIGKMGEDYLSQKSDAVPANYICTNEQPEGYRGKIAKDTIEVTYYYKLKASEIESSIDSKVITELERDEEGNYIIKAGEEIKYEIIYETKIKDYKGKVNIEIEAELPEGTRIDEEKCDLAGGTYDKESNTIKWVIDIEDVDTFANTMETMETTVTIGEHIETITKEVKIVYAEDYKLENINLKAKGETILYYPDDYPIEKDEPLIKDEVEEKEKGKVIIHHYIYDEEKNEYTTQKLVEDEEIEKEIGQEYTTSPSNRIPSDYECINEQPEGYIGEITKGTKEINYYYKLKTEPEEKQGKVIVEYVDIDEPDNGAYRYEINDTVGKEYETHEKEIKYYVLVRSTENTKGEIKEETQVVTYYYRKLDFNFSVEETIDGIQLDGESIEVTDNKLAKVEIATGKINNTNLIVKYNIKVKNQGELDGTAKVLKTIPEGYEIAYLPEEWKENKDGTIETKVELEAGESKNLSIALKWENKEENLGSKTNTVKIEETSNEANFEDTNKEDNKSGAIMIVSVKTGETVSMIIIGMIIIALVIAGYITYIVIRKKSPTTKDIKFLK